jgi:hypothetical protein
VPDYPKAVVPTMGRHWQEEREEQPTAEGAQMEADGLCVKSLSNPHGPHSQLPSLLLVILRQISLSISLIRISIITGLHYIFMYCQQQTGKQIQEIY